MKKKVHFACAQINSTVGDIKGNAEKIIESALYARDQKQADVVIFPELVLTGYPPEDLLLREELYNQIKTSLKKILDQVKNIYIILGLPTYEKGEYFNSAFVLYNGKIIAKYHKQLLPNEGVFDEKRYFAPGKQSCVVKIKGIKTGILICQDLWFKGPASRAKKKGAKLIIGLNASPFDMEKPSRREEILGARARENKLPIIYVNTIGAQDELVFDGGSLAVNSSGVITQRASFFKEDLMVVDSSFSKLPLGRFDITELVYQALVLGVRDYIGKNNFPGAIIGTSGGIDSALTLAIAVDALGKDRVQAVYLPSRFSSNLSKKTAYESAKLLKVKCTTISIEGIFKPFLKGLEGSSDGKLKNITTQNLQSRIRGVLLMALSNQTGSIVLTTGNKSEMAVGYATLYGDTAGGFCVLKDVFKGLVYKLAKYRNQISPAIPNLAITRAPTAELAKNQKDADDLPAYPILDEILERYIELNHSINKIVAAGFNKAIVTKIVQMIKRSEYKRRQAPPGIKITTCAFGRERRYPITSKFG
jgi:NAD+ synthase (glutamine-hydrolysing)